MSPARRRQSRRTPPHRGRGGSEPKPQDLWRRTPGLPFTKPIVPAQDPTALLRSLGPPPLQDEAAQHYLAAVVERAATIATALAASAGVLAESDDEVEPEAD